MKRNKLKFKTTLLSATLCLL